MKIYHDCRFTSTPPFSLLLLQFSCISIIARFNWMLAIMLEISASMTQLNTRVYAILETHSIKETGADIWRQRFHSVYENIRLRPSTGRRINGVFKFIHFGETFSNLCVYGERFHRLRVDGKPKRIKKFAFTIVFVWRGPMARRKFGNAVLSSRATNLVFIGNNLNVLSSPVASRTISRTL